MWRNSCFFIAEILSFKIQRRLYLLGIRRIEAITADEVTKHFSNIETDLQNIKSLVKNKDVVKGVSDLVSENKDLSRKIEVYKSLEKICLN